MLNFIKNIPQPHPSIGEYLHPLLGGGFKLDRQSEALWIQIPLMHITTRSATTHVKIITKANDLVLPAAEPICKGKPGIDGTMEEHDQEQAVA